MKRKRRDPDLRYAEVATPCSFAEVYHVSPSPTLPLATDAHQTVPPTAQDLYRTLGPLAPRHDPRPPLRPQQRGSVPGTPAGPQGKHPAAALARVLPGKNGQGGRQAGLQTPRFRSGRLLCPVAEMDPVLLFVSAAGPRFGPDDARRAPARLVRQRCLPRAGHPGGLEDSPGPAARTVAPPRVRPARLRPARPGDRLGGAGADRSRPGIAAFVRDDCGARLAPADAGQTGEQVSARGVAPLPLAGRFGRPGRRALRGCRSGLQDEPDTAGLHAAGLLGTRPRRAVVAADRPGAAGQQPMLVRLSGLDRTGVQGNQKRWLAMALYAHDRSGACGAALAGDRRGDAVGRGNRRGGGRGNSDRDDRRLRHGARWSAHASGVYARPGDPARSPAERPAFAALAFPSRT